MSHDRVKFVTILFMTWFITGTCARVCLICFNNNDYPGRCQGVWWGVSICRSPTFFFFFSLWQRSCAKFTIWCRGLLTHDQPLKSALISTHPPQKQKQKTTTTKWGGSETKHRKTINKHKGFMPNHWGSMALPCSPSGAAPALPCTINEMSYAF